MRRIPANLLLTIGLLAAFLGYSGWTLTQTIFNADAVARSAEQILRTPAVRTEITNRLIDTINREVPNASTQLDPVEVVNTANAAVQQEAFVTAFSDALRSLHGMVFGQKVSSVTLQAGDVGAAIRSAAETTAPGLAAQIPSDGIAVTLTTDDVPTLRNLPPAVETLTYLLFAIAVLCIVCAVAVHPDHAAALGRVGRWALVLGVTQLFLFWVLPRWGLNSVGGEWGEVTAAVLRGAGTPFLRGAVTIGVVGGLCLIGSEIWRTRRANAVRRLRNARLNA